MPVKNCCIAFVLVMEIISEYMNIYLNVPLELPLNMFTDYLYDKFHCNIKGCLASNFGKGYI